MAEILGLGCTHRPVMLRRDEDWTVMMRASLDDPDMPAEMKDPSSWPPQLRPGPSRRADRSQAAEFVPTTCSPLKKVIIELYRY